MESKRMPTSPIASSQSSASRRATRAGPGEPSTTSPGLDTATIRRVAQQVLGADAAVPSGWRVAPIGYAQVLGITGGLFRVEGDRWSAVLKVVVPQPSPAAVAETDGWCYWKREPRLYQSGLLADLPPGLRAPRCHGVDEREDGTVHIWLEDVADEVGPRWGWQRYARGAREIGRFNGAYLAGRPVPHHPACSRDWIRAYVAQTQAGGYAPSPELDWDHPVFPAPVRGRHARLLERREELFTAVDRLPRVFRHGDCFPNNLLPRGDETVAIDWAFAGPGPVGHDLCALVSPSLMFSLVAPRDATRLEGIALEGYVAGLREAGWRGDPALVRFAYAATTALHWGLIVPVWTLRLMRDPSGFGASWSRRLGRPLDQLVPQFAGWARYALDLGDEALASLPRYS
jgi:hypothetical protein